MNAPTLLIGLGGTGSKIVQKVANLVTPEQRRNIALVIFDTDINELREIEQTSPFVKTIQTSTRDTVGAYLKNDPLARDEWFPVNAVLNSKTLTEGAGQVRSISRLALETVIASSNMTKLEEAINDLYKVEEDKPEQSLRVVIVSSLAGGTGSGLILPVALYLRNYLGQRANITRGFFILPEVFFEVIPGQSERNNLKANAYAALRELDAFLMKSENTLHEKYKDTVSMKFPVQNRDYRDYEEYHVRPYDFCFLFDAQNAEGAKLNSFAQYLDHAANCIYAQSIGPMNKRSNSSEDNTIRKLAREKGRNRYAGAGASVLVYPFEDVRNYIALQWAKESISKQWLTYDNEYRALCEENRARQEKGIGAPTPDPKEHYMMAIESGEKKKDPFSRAIVRSCRIYGSDGVTELGDRWDAYLDALIEKIKGDEEEDRDDLKTQYEKAERKLKVLGTNWPDYATAFDEIEDYKKQVNKYVEETARTLAFSMFRKSDEARTTKPEAFELEYHLKGSDEKFMHPNAVRYFLNKSYASMLEALDGYREDLDTLRTGFSEAEVTIFDDKSTPEKEKKSSASTRKVPLATRISNKPAADQQGAAKKLRSHLENVKTYKITYMLVNVLEEGCNYISELLKAFEMFYGSFEVKVSGLEKTIGDIKKKYKNRPGSTMRYVCADEKCLESIYKKKQYIGSAISIDSDLAKNIYDKILGYAMLDEKPSNNRYFSELFDKDILGYYEKYVMQKYGDSIDIDIIRALETEAVMVHPEYEEAENASELIEQYVKKVIANTRALSCPFIESPLGEAREPINACAFNNEMSAKYREDPSRADLIKKELMNFGGVADEDVPKNMVMFYQSFYGLRANDLSKFAPPEKSSTYSRNPGEYFRAYYELVSRIHPDSTVSREISPHLDRWWHIVTKMPDLDEENQKKQEYEINAAFFWSILNKYVTTVEEGSGKMLYVTAKEELEMESNRLIVSDGNPCDKLYEVVDAIAIYPELIRKILARVEIKKQADLNKNRPWNKGILMKQLECLEIDYPGVGRGKNEQPAHSIFTIPHLMKKSATPNIYYEDCVIEILRVEIEEIKKYLANFFTQKEMPEYLHKIMMKQFERYLADLEIEAVDHPIIYKESLFNQICTILAKTLENYDYDEDAEYIRGEADRLKKLVDQKRKEAEEE